MKLIKDYPLSCLVFVAVLYLSLFTPPEIPELEDIRYIDKWTHLCMYGGFTATILYEYFKQHGMRGLHLKTVKAETLNWRLCQITAFWFPFLLGGVIEIIQENCTGGRRGGDVIDWIADGLGSVIVYIVVYKMVRSAK